MLKFVEVIRTVVTEDAVVDDVKGLAQRLGKLPVVVGDKAGFIANALLFGYLNHAVWPGIFVQRGIGFISLDQEDRGALALVNGIVYVPFSGYWATAGITMAGW